MQGQKKSNLRSMKSQESQEQIQIPKKLEINHSKHKSNLCRVHSKQIKYFNISYLKKPHQRTVKQIFLCQNCIEQKQELYKKQPELFSNIISKQTFKKKYIDNIIEKYFTEKTRQQRQKNLYILQTYEQQFIKQIDKIKINLKDIVQNMGQKLKILITSKLSVVRVPFDIKKVKQFQNQLFSEELLKQFYLNTHIFDNYSGLFQKQNKQILDQSIKGIKKSFEQTSIFIKNQFHKISQNLKSFLKNSGKKQNSLKQSLNFISQKNKKQLRQIDQVSMNNNISQCSSSSNSKILKVNQIVQLKADLSKLKGNQNINNMKNQKSKIQNNKQKVIFNKKQGKEKPINNQKLIQKQKQKNNTIRQERQRSRQLFKTKVSQIPPKKQIINKIQPVINILPENKQQKLTKEFLKPTIDRPAKKQDIKMLGQIMVPFQNQGPLLCVKYVITRANNQMPLDVKFCPKLEFIHKYSFAYNQYYQKNLKKQEIHFFKKKQ